MDRLAVVDNASVEEVLALDAALEHLARENKPCADLVKLRFISGLTHEESAACLGSARRTANRYWAFARARWCWRRTHQTAVSRPRLVITPAIPSARTDKLILSATFLPTLQPFHLQFLMRRLITVLAGFLLRI